MYIVVCWPWWGKMALKRYCIFVLLRGWMSDAFILGHLWFQYLILLITVSEGVLRSWKDIRTLFKRTHLEWLRLHFDMNHIELNKKLSTIIYLYNHLQINYLLTQSSPLLRGLGISSQALIRTS